MDDFDDIIIPFIEFSSKWDEATGDITVSCQDDSQYCPNQRWLSNMETISFWGEGIEGTIDLEIQKIEAVGCTTTTTTTTTTPATSVEEVVTAASISGSNLSATIGGGGPTKPSSNATNTNFRMLSGAFAAVVVVVVLAVVQQTRKRQQLRASYDEIPTTTLS